MIEKKLEALFSELSQEELTAVENSHIDTSCTIDADLSVRIAKAVEEKRKTDMFGLAKGILPIILGTVIIMRADQFSSLVIFLFGMAILGDALYNLPVALLIKKNGFSAWWITLIGAILGAAAGLFVIFFPGLSANTVVVLIGAFLVWDSLLNFTTNILSTKFLKEKNND